MWVKIRLPLLVTALSLSWSLFLVCGMQVTDLVSIVRRPLQCGNAVLTMRPADWLSRAGTARKAGSLRIKEVVVVPSLLPVNPFELEFEDDDHLCSQLCDGGLVVHTLTHCAESLPKHGLDVNKATESALLELFAHRTAAGVPSRSICVVGWGLSALWVLNFLADRALPMGTERLDVGAVVLIDPPSISATYIPEEREALVGQPQTQGADDAGRDLEISGNTLGKIWDSSVSVHSGRQLKSHTGDGVPRAAKNKDDGDDKDEDDYAADMVLFQRESFEKSNPLVRAMRERREAEQKMRDRINGFSAPSSPPPSYLFSPLPAPQLTKGGFITLDSLVGPVDVVGTPPRNGPAVGSALADRILVVSTADSVGSVGSVAPKSPWGSHAVQELAALYQAGPVITCSDCVGTPSQTNEVHDEVASVVLDWLRLLPEYVW